VNWVLTANTCSLSITEDNFQISTEMITKGTEAWNYFIALIDSHVSPDEALRMTRSRFAIRDLVDQMNNDLNENGIEKD
jgi:hypothetical protein